MWPHEHEIPQGTVLYRFIDIGKSPSIIAADGPWWFEFEYYQKIRHFSRRHGYPIGYSARMFAAILYEWSAVNAVVRAEVASGPLKVWKGKGKQVAAKGKDERDVIVRHRLLDGHVQTTVSREMTPLQSQLEVLQLFIPGLGEPHKKFGSLMKLLGSEQIPSG